MTSIWMACETRHSKTKSRGWRSVKRRIFGAQVGGALSEAISDGTEDINETIS